MHSNNTESTRVPSTPPPDNIPHGPRTPRAVLGVISLLMAISFVCYVNRVSIATAGDTRIMAQYEISPTRMGWVYSSFLLTYTVCMIPGGLFIDRLGPRAALMSVLVGSSVFVALTGLIGRTMVGSANVFVALVVIRGLMGVVSAPLYPACAASVERWVPARGRSRTNGLVTGSALVGVAASPALFGALIDWLDWPGAFLIAACVTLVLATVWYTFVGSESPSVRQRATEIQPSGDLDRRLPSWWSLLTNRDLLLLTLSYGAVGYFQYLFFYWMNFYFLNVLKLPESKSRAYAAIPPLAMAVGMPVGGWLSDRLEHALGPQRGRRIMPIVGMSFGAALLTVGVFTRDPDWIVTWFALALGAVGTTEGAFWVTAIELGGRRGGSSAAIFNTGGNAGGILAPVLTPWIGQLYGWGCAVGLGAMICLLGVGLWLGIDVRRDRRESKN
jgi:MFS transporter, ACS family, D-galactonate transporter